MDQQEGMIMALHIADVMRLRGNLMLGFGPAVNAVSQKAKRTSSALARCTTASWWRAIPGPIKSTKPLRLQNMDNKNVA